MFTVDNLDYVRRDAYMTGVAVGPVDVERLRRYSFIGPSGLSLYEPGLGSLEMFLTARLFMYRQVYFHRTVRAIDLDLAEVFAESIAALAGEASPSDALAAYADLDEYALLHQAARWARGESLSGRPQPVDGTVRPEIGDGSRAILLRRPRWRSEAEIRTEYDGPEPPAEVIARLGPAIPGQVAIDLASVDAKPTGPSAALTVVSREGGPPLDLGAALGRLPAYALVARRFRRLPSS